MAKKYYRWKDENCNGVNPEWVEMTGQEYFEFKRNLENKHRKFIEYIDEYDESDTVVLETTKKKYDEWNREMHRQLYYKKMEKHFVKAFVSLDMDVDGEEEMTLHEAVADMRVNLKATVEKNILVEKLGMALKTLSTEEQDLVYAMFLSDSPMNERDYADLLGMSKTAINYRKKIILKKLKVFLDQN